MLLKNVKIQLMGWLIFFSFHTFAQQQNKDFETWLIQQYHSSISKLVHNVEPLGTQPGTVVASPSKESPNYFYHWVRDASLVMSTLHKLYLETGDSKFNDYLYHYLQLTEVHQNQKTAGGLGEVKFFVDGTAFQGPWGRPQNDGPALRALALIPLIQADSPKTKAWNARVYYIIKKDLEYTSREWKSHDFDLWEEIKGHHFFTRIHQRRALIEGARIAQFMKDPAASDWYLKQAITIEHELQKHWSDTLGIYQSTLDRTEGIAYKGGMDASTILAVIHNDFDQFQDPQFSVLQSKFMSTVQKIKDRFAYDYPINHIHPQLGTAIGRYPEDQYDGYRTGSLGNPWFLTTAAFAQYYYELAAAIKKSPDFKVDSYNIIFIKKLLPTEQFTFRIGQTIHTQSPLSNKIFEKLMEEGDLYLKRMRFHMEYDGSMSEQMNRHSGYMQGARDLTWSYSSYIDAYLARKLAKNL